MRAVEHGREPRLQQRRLTVAQLVLLLTLAATVGACSLDDSGLSPSDFDTAWTDEAGALLPDGVGEANAPLVINTVRGAEHCDWASVVLLHLQVPIGQPSTDPYAMRQYVRDPNSDLPREWVVDDLRPDAALPPDAEPTGFHNGEFELWTAASTFERDIYVGRDGEFEAWPRSVPPGACA